MIEYYLGVMSGTSVDGIDTTLATFNNDQLHVIGHHAMDFPMALRDTLLQVGTQSGPLPDNALALEVQLTDSYERAIRECCQTYGLVPSQLTAVGLHGQTVRHCPEAIPPYSIQWGDAQRLATQLGCAVIGQFRQGDLDVGGQGAPLAPAFHQWLISTRTRPTAVINIGGIANITYLPLDDAPIIGFDTGPGNGLMDSWIQKQLGAPFDRSGAWALQGQAIPALLSRLLADPYFEQSPPKSTGRDHFNLSWLEQQLSLESDIYRPIDIQSTLLSLTVESIAQAIHAWLPHGGDIVLCGGGALNTALCHALDAHLGQAYHLSHTDRFGIGIDWVESSCFAWLAYQRWHQRASNIPSVTGAQSAVSLGTIYYP